MPCVVRDSFSTNSSPRTTPTPTYSFLPAFLFTSQNHSSLLPSFRHCYVPIAPSHFNVFFNIDPKISLSLHCHTSLVVILNYPISFVSL
ncbi:hypothetical protein L2E82_36671 [Cichorium intybus]|uniref:Uncharacterized protein n=1 Tax=Cichorium intybus TaxID=13427 RepID=A0ACB9ADV3_CICIN|nr:hypothetical protein L2E82_36671 [Cichorium intybus]